MVILSTVSTEGDVLDSASDGCNHALRIHARLLHRVWKHACRRPRLGYFAGVNLLRFSGRGDPLLDLQSKADLFGRLFPVGGGLLPPGALVNPYLGAYLHRDYFFVWTSDSVRVPCIFIIWHSSSQQRRGVLLNC